MNRQISFGQYRIIDLLILLAVMVFSTILIYIAASVWFPNELYVVSTVGAFVTLVMMRWSGYAAIHAVVGGIVYTTLAGGTWQQYVVFSVGNLASLLALFMFMIFGKERIRKSAWLTVIFAICVQLLMQLGRAGLAALLGYPVADCLGLITTESLSILFTAFVAWTVRRIDGLFEDQKIYLLRLERERQLEGREQF